MPSTTYTFVYTLTRSSDLFQAHNSETDFRYLCGISSCLHVFVARDSFDAFHSHCKWYHYNWKAQFVNEDEDTFSEMEVHVNNSDQNVSVVHEDDLEDSTVEGDHPDNGCLGDDVSNAYVTGPAKMDQVGIIYFNHCFGICSIDT